METLRVVIFNNEKHYFLGDTLHLVPQELAEAGISNGTYKIHEDSFDTSIVSIESLILEKTRTQ